MLKSINRLAKRGDIQEVFTKGRIFFNPYFNVKFLPSGTGKRMTVVVSTKVFKKAVSRNRLKRIIREWLGKNMLSIRSGSYVIIAKPKVSSVGEKEVFKNFLLVFNKISNAGKN